MKQLFGERFRSANLVFCLLFLAGCQTTSPLDSEKDSELSNYLLAIYAGAQGDRARASESYLKVLKNNPQNNRLLEEAFSFFLYNGEYENALKVGRDFYTVKPANTPVAMLLSLEAFKAGEITAMEGYLSQVKGFGFDNLMAPLMKAWAAARNDNTQTALAALEPLLETAPFEPFYAEHRAFILDYSGWGAAAEVAYSALVNRKEITSLQPVLSFGSFLARRNRDDEALALYQKFQDLFPDNLQIEGAIKRLQAGKVPSRGVRDPDRAMALGFLRTGVELGRDRAFLPAIVYTRFALYLDPGLDEAYLFLGNLLSNETHPGLALDAFSSVAPDGPFSETALLRKAFVLNAHDQWPQAITLVENYLTQNPGSENALMALGDLYRTREEYLKALAYYQRVSTLKGELGPNDWFLLFARAISYERLDRWEEAEADFLKALEFHPEDPDIMNYLGYSWIDRGLRLNEGRDLIERAVKQRPTSGFIVDSLGWAQYLLGEYKEAVETLERAVTLEPSDPTLNDHLGDAYWKVGREREARFQWDHALGLDPAPEDQRKIEAKIAYGFNLAEALRDRK